MKRLRYITTLLTALAFALSGLAGADDGAITNKSMSKTIHVPLFDQEIVNRGIKQSDRGLRSIVRR